MLFSFNFKDVGMKVKEFKRLIADFDDDKDFIIDNRLDIDSAIYIEKGDDLRIVIEKKLARIVYIVIMKMIIVWIVSVNWGGS